MVLKFGSCSQKQCGFYLKSIRVFIPKLWFFIFAKKFQYFYLKKWPFVNFCWKADKFQRIFKVIMTLEWNHILTSNETKLFLTTRSFIWNPVLVVLNNASGRYKQKYWIFNTKMIVKVTKGEIWSGTISKNWFHQEYYLCGKFHTCIKKQVGTMMGNQNYAN